MLHLIQDDIIRRALDFFGLRGVIPHQYEATIVPVLVVGETGSPLILQRPTPPLNPLADIWLVPPGESWHPILLAGTLTQAAAVTTARWRLQFLSASGASFGTQNLPALWDSLATFSVGEATLFTPAINQQTNFTVRFPKDFTMGPGSRITFIAAPGDGVVTIEPQSFLMYQRVGERMVELR
jgi:hypothetical protein